MTANKPYFTVVIPTYNRAHLIGMTLKSVLTQTFTDFEVIVVDDGGKDDTEAVVKALGSNKVQYFRKENGERGAARNYGWQIANGEYVTFLDSDDLFYADHLQLAYEFMTQLQEKPKCFAQAYEIKDAHTDKVIVSAYQTTQPTINNVLVKGNILSCFGVFLKTELFEEVKFEEDRHFAGSEDWLLWLQLAARYPFFYNNAVSGALLEHDDRSVLSFNEQSLLFRTEHLKQKLGQDTAFLKTFGPRLLKKIHAHMLTYSSLHLAMSREKRKAIYYLQQALKTDYKEIFNRRCLAIIKHILFS
ncbi:glycosyltransferase family 2 protein [Flavisolibacter tropicus]|uniref:Glycosyltransferase 2-like domain-containing protein n=1 Tax=Flavisolibacter tropicus TaxID=1492898 RepID=A0A172U0A1_9BACT|nr:glycosyltransferase family A protein [Flavisolibacter tropicus]ANE52453.1 hypothetical protein SY85_20180 [Flavisolibacter tropicus]